MKKPSLSRLKKLVSSLDYIRTHFEKCAMNRKSSAIKHLPEQEDLINDIWKKCVILYNEIKNNPEKILSTQELVRKSKWMIFLDKLTTSNPEIQSILHIELFQILVQELILQEKACKPFWTPVYKELSEKLWLPTETDFPDLVSTLSNASLSRQEENSQSWMMMETKALNRNLQKTYYPLSISTVANKWEKEVTKLKNLKIQLKPNQMQKKILKEWIDTSRYVYNKTIALINSGHTKNPRVLCDLLVTDKTRKYHNNYSVLTNQISILKKQEQNDLIKEEINKLKNERKAIVFEKNLNIKDWELNTPKVIRDDAVRDVIKAHNSGFANFKAGNIRHFKLGFRKAKNNRQSCVLAKSLLKVKDGKIQIAPTYLIKNKLFHMGKKTLKKYRNLKINNDCRLLYERNKFWLCIPVPTIMKEKTETNNYCGIDPGVRTFLTCFGNNGVIEYKQNKELLKKLNKKIDTLNSLRIRKRNKIKIEARKENLINEIHWKCINDILKRNDYVFYGDIKSHDIVKKSDNKSLNRNINDLKFYLFKQRLNYKAGVWNKKVFQVNEAYTTKTCSSCGHINDVGNKEIFKCDHCNITLLRDVSAAKNILMKGLLSLPPAFIGG
ncbi:MAG: Heterosigma akashiwo virus 01 [Bacteroidota bacterium]